MIFQLNKVSNIGTITHTNI